MSRKSVALAGALLLLLVTGCTPSSDIMSQPSIRISADGSVIAFLEPMDSQFDTRLAFLDVEAGTVAYTPFTIENEQGYEWAFDWSADGTQFAYARFDGTQWEILSANGEDVLEACLGADVCEFPTSVLATYPPDTFITQVSWSPDHARLLIAGFSFNGNDITSALSELASSLNLFSQRASVSLNIEPILDIVNSTNSDLTSIDLTSFEGSAELTSATIFDLTVAEVTAIASTSGRYWWSVDGSRVVLNGFFAVPVLINVETGEVSPKLSDELNGTLGGWVDNQSVIANDGTNVSIFSLDSVSSREFYTADEEEAVNSISLPFARDKIVAVTFVYLEDDAVNAVNFLASLVSVPSKLISIQSSGGLDGTVSEEIAEFDSIIEAPLWMNGDEELYIVDRTFNENPVTAERSIYRVTVETGDVETLYTGAISVSNPTAYVLFEEQLNAAVAESQE
jgi:hypothetical protein